MNEKPYVPFYKPYGMSDEEYQYEVAQAEKRLAKWEWEQEQIKISSNLSVMGELVCPFCNDIGFDKVGLKQHLETYCEEYRQTNFP